MTSTFELVWRPLRRCLEMEHKSSDITRESTDVGEEDVMGSVPITR